MKNIFVFFVFFFFVQFYHALVKLEEGQNRTPSNMQFILNIHIDERLCIEIRLKKLRNNFLK